MSAAIQLYTVLSINGEKWTAYRTDAKSDRRRWYFQCCGKSLDPWNRRLLFADDRQGNSGNPRREVVMPRRKMQIGDLLTFKAATRYSYRKATRKITGFMPDGRPEVTYAGWQGFIVQPREIISVARP